MRKCSSLALLRRFDYESSMRSSLILHFYSRVYICRLSKNFKIEQCVTKFKNLQVNCKNNEWYEMIFIKSNLIYWLRYWLFDALQLMSIEIYLYFTFLRARLFLNRSCFVYWSYSCCLRYEFVEDSFVESSSEISCSFSISHRERSEHDHTCRTDSTD